MWGGASKQLISSLYVTQKRLVRLIFGNTEAFLNKFCSSARTRPLNEQILGHEFYRKECTKPLFHKNKILTIHNLYSYMCVNEIAKVITNKSPIILSESITISHRNKKNIIILPNNPIASNQFLYASSSKWNFFVKKLKVPSQHEIVPNVLKYKIKNYLLNLQNSCKPDQWIPSNMELA